MEKLSLNVAREIITRTIEYVKRKIKKPYSIAVVDEWGEAIALYRMEDAPFGTAELARDKAWTAAAFKMPSSEVSKFGDPKKPHFGLPAANWNERLTTIQGGFPIESEGKVIGALGVSGGSPEDDVKVGKKSLKIFREVS